MRHRVFAGILAFTCLVSPLSLAGEDGRERQLAAAVIEGNIEAVERLLDEGTDVNAALAEGIWPLDVARIRGRKSIEKLLISRGAKKANAKSFPPGTLAPDLAELYLTSGIAAASPGFSVLVSRDGKELFCRGYGLARVKEKLAAGPDTPFRIGSVTKQFTSAAILKLREDGKPVS